MAGAAQSWVQLPTEGQVPAAAGIDPGPGTEAARTEAEARASENPGAPAPASHRRVVPAAGGRN